MTDALFAAYRTS